MHQAINPSTVRLASKLNQREFKRQRGFTFIEIMIAVTIVGILAALALPSYGNYVRDARRADGHLALLKQAQAMERCRSTNWSYVGCTLTSAASEEGHYTIAIDATATTATAYALTATATGAQVNDTVCSPLTLNHLSAKGPSDCWKN